MQREFVYTADKSSLGHGQLNNASNISMGSVQEKTFGGPNGGLPVKNNYDLGGPVETSGTYRARSNNPYDNSDNSMMTRGGGNPYGDFRNFKVDYDEYWKTNI
jgi:hypothetical protein